MRIIAGAWKSKRILSPSTERIRPTLDTVKESVFSILKNYIQDADVLDLFAGTGNLGIEALSRGASFVWFNDIDSEAIKIISKNVILTDYQTCVKITRKDYDKCLKQLSSEKMKFDIIFLDPPYTTKCEEKALEKIVIEEILKKDGIIVLETDKRKEFNENVKGLILKDKRIYGRVMIRLYEWEVQ